MTVGRGHHNGKIIETVAKLIERKRDQLTPAILMALYGIDRQQAWNVLNVAKKRGLIRAVARGVYEMAEAS